ncbi:hypothetical protein Tco_0858762 [Tanacetum coccineum]|uniref:Uncharacterized protein n=1 Tax=Tanacetum coccineum TaxID=301880 RepID=A0ABQ5BA67_9ASTR
MRLFIRRGDSVERAITTDATKDSDNIIRTQTTTMPNVDIPQGMDTGGSPRRQDTMGVLLLRLGLRGVLEKPNEPLFSEGHNIKRFLALEEAKIAQDSVINRLKLRVKRLEKKRCKNFTTYEEEIV